MTRDSSPHRASTAASPDPCLPLCEVLEQEYAAITCDAPDTPPSWQFTPEQIIEPERQASRLIDRHDRAARELADDELAGLVTALRVRGTGASRDELRRLLAEGLNAILPDEAVYHPDKRQRFAGIKFRSQTVDRLDGPFVELNRLILEDTFFELEKVFDRRLRNLYRKIHRKGLAALCLSGGGIRSATFGLGVVQGLARNGLLDQFQYLSTVSGGGYLGGWLSAWISHTSLAQVIQQLRVASGRPLEPEPTPIWHLRTYSNYLSPRLGLLSADSWTLVATYTRNLFLNWLVLVPTLVGVLTLPLVLIALLAWDPSGNGFSPQPWLAAALVVLAFGCGVQTVAYVHVNRPAPHGTTEGTGLDDAKRGQRDFLRSCLTPLLVAVVGAVVCWAWAPQYVDLTVRPGRVTMAFATIGILVHLGGWLLAPHRRGPAETRSRFARAFLAEALFILLTGAAAGLAAWWLANWARPLFALGFLGFALYAWLAVPGLLSLILLFSHIYVGYSSSKQVDAAREWAARFSAWVLIVAVGWLVGVGLVVMGPIAADWVRGYLQDHAGASAPALLAGLKAVGGAAGVISGLVTLLLGRSRKTPGPGDTNPAPMSLALKLAAPVFVGFLVVLLGWAGVQLTGAARELAAGSEAPDAPSGAAVGVTTAVTAVLILFGLVTARCVDTNKFSLHAMYRARLIRAYLGASRPAGERDPNPFTGFDDNDNLPLRRLWPRPGADRPGPAQRPFHVVNVALNLVGGGNLAWQQRKAESFTFSPLHCGAPNQGYRPTWSAQSKDDEPMGYGGERGVSLGTAITISGAAVSPNMGYHSSTVISLLLTLFNLRLGWWLGNPGHAGRDVYLRSAPRSSLGLIVDEALGRTDNKHPYVYLSDGGHFENLGLYEMVLRRCHTIVVSDGGADPLGAFEDLGNAIRKIRIDFGIPIEFRIVPIYARDGRGVARAGKYCAIGTIRYSCVDEGAPDGTLIYLKPAFYGDEPRDVFNYAQTSRTFPHETTGDQFFSEAQFESYRALGSYVIDQVVGGWSPSTDATQGPLARFARQVNDYLGRADPV
jgi:hypothetical protein